MFNKAKIKITIFFLIFSCVSACNPNEYITVNKQGVAHTFVPFDTRTDYFVKNIFAGWEKETFTIFESVKDPQGIALDLGAWIGTTAIWLSKNFYHVIAVDADKVSLQCLERNLKASECSNVTICGQPIADKAKPVIFGCRGMALNESMSYIKNDDFLITAPDDFLIRSITFKQLIHDYVAQNEKIKSHHITFIKCDIEGGEENILQDILEFAYHNRVKVYLSFHLNWWKSKKITDFEYLFKMFKTNCPCSNICFYLIQNPFASLLFERFE